MSELKLPRGTLWRSVVERTEQALRTGALVPIPTEQYFIADGGIRFVVRRAVHLERKKAASTYRVDSAENHASRPPNPFLPHEEDLFVAEISDTHIALLNKFNVVEHHLLMVTRSFEDQERPLTESDFAAMWACMREYDALVFYNSGEIAGASQRHKHLQMVPLPLTPAGPRCPMDPLIASADYADGLGRVAALPFPHTVASLGGGVVEEPTRAARDTRRLYRAMLETVCLNPRQPAPYNLLVTRDWMLLVPRARECFAAISINGLGFAGSFFVKSESDLGLLRETGPLAALASVAGAQQKQ